MKNMKKHIVVIDFYGKKYRIGILAERRSEAVIQAMSKARLKVRISDDAENKIDEIETQFANASMLVDLKDKIGGMDKYLEDMKTRFIIDNPSSETIKPVLIEMLSFFQSFYDFIDIVGEYDDME